MRRAPSLHLRTPQVCRDNFIRGRQGSRHQSAHHLFGVRQQLRQVHIFHVGTLLHTSQHIAEMGLDKRGQLFAIARPTRCGYVVHRDAIQHIPQPLGMRGLRGHANITKAQPQSSLCQSSRPGGEIEDATNVKIGQQLFKQFNRLRLLPEKYGIRESLQQRVGNTMCTWCQNG